MSDEIKNVSRREFLKLAGIAGATLGVGAGVGGFLASCGGETTTTTGATTATTAAATSSTAGVATTAVSAGTETTAAAAQLAIPLGSGQHMVNIAETAANDYFKEWQRGAQQACDALGLTQDYLSSNMDANLALSQMETAGTQGVKLAVSCTPGPGPLPQVAAAANKYKISYCNTWDCPEWVLPQDMGFENENSYFVTYFSPLAFKIHYLKTKLLFDKMGGEGGLVHISGLPGGSADWHRTVACDMALKEYPKIKLLYREAGSWVRDKSQTAMEAAIARFGKDIKGVIGQNDDEAAGCIAALDAANMTDVPVVGSDGTSEALNFIKSGRMLATVMDIATWQAGYMVVRAFDRANGWMPSPVERIMNSEGILATTDNVQQIMDKFINNKEPAFDFKLMSQVLHPDDWDVQNGLVCLRPDDWWGPGPVAKPADWDAKHPEYVAAVKAGDYDKYDKLYADHYKKKTYDGIPKAIYG